MNSFSLLPNDLLQGFIIPKYFLGSIRTERDLGSAFPVMLLVLQLVSKQFNNSVRRCNLAWKAVQLFRNRTPSDSGAIVSHMLKEACRLFGSVALLKWLSKALHYPILQHSCYVEAAIGDVIVVRQIALTVLSVRRALAFARLAS